METPIFRSTEGRDLVWSRYRSLLMPWVTPFEEHRVETSQGSTFVLQSGRPGAPAVFLLHGSGSNTAMWAEEARILSRQFRVCSVDIIGECGFSAPSRPPFQPGLYGDWLAEVMNGLGVSSAHLAGCSLGGWIALDALRNHAHRIRSVALLAPAGLTPVRPSMVGWILWTALAGSRGFRKLNRVVYGSSDIPPEALEFASLIRDQYRPRTGVLPLFRDEELRSISAPLWYAGGEKDCFYDSANAARRLNRLVPHARTRVLENTGHVLLHQGEALMRFFLSPNHGT
ncbi:MAG: alpha/beta hydrolase [Bacteroidales bacterium]